MDRQTAKFDLRSCMGRLWLLMPLCLCIGLSGCTSIISPINAIPAELVPPEFLAPPQANKQPIDVSLLRNIKPPAYILDQDDILGVFIDGVLGNSQNEPPPVTIPDPQSDLSPGIGFPIPVREDGTISLPLIDPIPVRGLTVGQVEELVKRRYREEEILVDARVIVTLLRKRTYRVFVVRQDNVIGNNGGQVGLQQRTRGVFDRSDLSSRGFVLQLPAYENDVLNALSQTGGLPGLNAKAEVTILRGDNLQTEERFRQMQQMYAGQFNPAAFANPALPEQGAAVTIPLRVAPGEIPNFRPEDVILRDGDVVYVESRETEVYYTGGLLGGGEWPIPRDYDLDVLGAVAISGTSIGVGPSTLQGQGIGGSSQVPPTELIILSKLPGNRQIAMRLNLNQAVNDPRSRILIHKGDTLILRYSPEEEVLNFAISTFFTFGIRQLFNNR